MTENIIYYNRKALNTLIMNVLNKPLKYTNKGDISMINLREEDTAKEYVDKISLINDKLTGVCAQLKDIITSGAPFNSSQPMVADVLNEIFPENQCIDVILTKNTDNMFFGVIVNPTITNVDLMSILVDTDDVDLDRYVVEIDSKAVCLLDPDDLAVYLVRDIDAMMNKGAIADVRAYLDILLAKQDDSIDLKNSINYSNILIYGIKHTMRQLTALSYNLNDKALSSSRLGTVVDTIKRAVPALSSVVQSPEMGILAWCLLIYRNLDTEYKEAIEVLNNAKSSTGSQVEKDEVDKVVKALRRASSESIAESVQYDMLHEKGFSLFKSLKKNGLRGIEDDLFEYKVRIKNCTEQEDAIYILRCINTRLGILEDYLDNNEVGDREREHWMSVMDQYRMLRYEVGKKKFQSASKNFNAFLNIDYDALDALDRKPAVED
jgi:hypothetical protein